MDTLSIGVNAIRRRCSEGEQFQYLMFWGHQPEAAGHVDRSCLSQWYPSEFTIAGVEYATAEHWMMASKAKLFHDDESLSQIIKSSSPREAKKLGRKVKHFSDQLWSQHRVQFVYQGNLAKFVQNESLRAFLVNTGDRVLVEASPNDDLWGIGVDADDERAIHPFTWRGENLLGFILMEVRTKLRDICSATKPRHGNL
jgi:ribA/ribD-fused uncharacterized protein